MHPIKFFCCLKGLVHHRFQENIENNTFQQYQNSIVASKNTNGHILRFTANTEIQVGSLEVDRAQFQNKVYYELRSLSPELKKQFTDKLGLNEFYYQGYYSLQIADLFSNIEAFENNDFVRRMFLKGQAYNIVTHQIIQHHDDINEEEGSTVLRSYEITQIKKASKLLDNDQSDLDVIDKIAEEVVLNINKLQLGFKHLYQTTVMDTFNKNE